jgi:uncharacterized protein (UPF0332 family)
VTPESRDQIARARQALGRAIIILAAGVAEDAGRGAYIASLQATRALIFDRTGKVARTHRGARTAFFELARDDAILTDYAEFLTQAFALKEFADYGTGPRTGVSLDEAKAAIEKAGQFIAHIERLLE